MDPRGDLCGTADQCPSFSFRSRFGYFYGFFLDNPILRPGEDSRQPDENWTLSLGYFRGFLEGALYLFSPSGTDCTVTFPGAPENLIPRVCHLFVFCNGFTPDFCFELLENRPEELYVDEHLNKTFEVKRSRYKFVFYAMFLGRYSRACANI